MSFAAAFYNFSVDLNHVDAQVFTRFRLKTARHPEESLEHLYARMIAYAHCYREGQTFSQGLFDQREPTIWQKDVTGDLHLWVEIGAPDRKKLEIALRAGPSVEYRVYFYSTEQIPLFCHYLRGSKTNWVKEIQFYELSSDFLERLAPLERSSPEWSITFVDNHIYLVIDGMEFESAVRPVDIWAEYQTSLEAELQG
jgi:uncharacterized protein YaeQ